MKRQVVKVLEMCLMTNVIPNIRKEKNTLQEIKEPGTS